MVNNIIVSADALPAVNCNSSTNGFPAGPTPLVIDHNDIYNSVGPALGNLCASQAGTYGNISSDPRFTSPSTGNFHLLASSPAIDAGTTSVLDLPLTDLDGTPRTLDSTSKQYPIVDMGPYESAGLADAVPTTLVITPSAYSVATGSTVTLSGHVASTAGVPTGTVLFTLDNATSSLALVDSSGNASALFPPLSAGLHTFSAFFTNQSSAGTAPPAVAVKVFVLASGGAPPSPSPARLPSPTRINSSILRSPISRRRRTARSQPPSTAPRRLLSLSPAVQVPLPLARSPSARTSSPLLLRLLSAAIPKQPPALSSSPVGPRRPALPTLRLSPRLANPSPSTPRSSPRQARRPTLLRQPARLRLLHLQRRHPSVAAR